MIISFFPHPQKIISQKKIYEIYNFERKKELLINSNINSLFIIEFNKTLANTSAENFLKFLIQKISVQCFLIGYDFSFGKDKQGNIDTIKKVADKNNIEVILIEPYLQKEKIISSSLIRQLLQKGDFQEANTQLGLPWHLKGEVCEGKKLALKIGFPTINIKLDFLPPFKIGVYAVKVRVKDKWYDAVANYGFAPTIKQDPLARNEQAILECHLFDFNENIYYQKVVICPLKFLRNELKFERLEVLKKQIQKDKTNAKKLFKTDSFRSFQGFVNIPN